MDLNDDINELVCNVSIIKALLQFFSIAEQTKVEQWLTKIQEEDNGLPNTKARNEYLLHLLINLQNGTLMAPFNKSPPKGKLKTLCKVLPDYAYEDLKNQFKTSISKMKKMLNDNPENYETPNLRCKPSDFISEQPRPRKGVTASLAVFSNYDENV